MHSPFFTNIQYCDRWYWIFERNFYFLQDWYDHFINLMFWIKWFSPFQAFVEDFLHHFAAFCYRSLCILWDINQNHWEMNEEIEKKMNDIMKIFQLLNFENSELAYHEISLKFISYNRLSMLGYNLIPPLWTDFSCFIFYPLICNPLLFFLSSCHFIDNFVITLNWSNIWDKNVIKRYFKIIVKKCWTFIFLYYNQ